MKLNQVTIKDKTPLPLIREVINRLKEVWYFNKLDLIWEYNNIWIKEGDEWKAAFLTSKGLFKPQVIYFGLCNSSGTFQWIMNSIFWESLHKDILTKLYRQLCNSGKNNQETKRIDSSLFEDCRKTQSVFQECQVWFTPGWKSAEWTRRWVDLWNDLGFSLCAVPSVCRVVATSDEEGKV